MLVKKLATSIDYLMDYMKISDFIFIFEIPFFFCLDSNLFCSDGAF